MTIEAIKIKVSGKSMELTLDELRALKADLDVLLAEKEIVYTPFPVPAPAPFIPWPYDRPYYLDLPTITSGHTENT